MVLNIMLIFFKYVPHNPTVSLSLVPVSVAARALTNVLRNKLLPLDISQDVV